MPPATPAERRSTCTATVTVIMTAFLMLNGCSRDTEAPEPHRRFSLGELAIHPREVPRSYFLSDRKGGFLLGRTGADSAWTPTWSVDGRQILRTVEIRVADTLLTGTMIRDVEVRPDRVSMDFGGLGRVVWSPVEELQGLVWGLSLNVETGREVSVSLRIVPGAGFADVRERAGGSWRETRGKKFLALSGGAEATWSVRDLVFRVGHDHRAVLLLSDAPVSPDGRFAVHSRLPELMARRTGRMEKVLERSYLRLSDSVMTTALAWARLSVDAMVVERSETLAVSVLPWDGTYDGRSNLQALAGLGLISGDYGTVAGLLRSWGATQDLVNRKTFGRIASRLHGSPPEYRGVDVGAWFARGVYDYVVATNDTAPLASMFPVVRRGIEGMRRTNVTRDNLVVHRADETWMGDGRFDGARGPYCAVEVQTLWRYQQMIGGILAQSRGDTVLAKSWLMGAVGTAKEFAKAFVDTGTNDVYDYLDGAGRGIDILRPNAMLALDGIESERVRRDLLKRSVSGLLYPHGPGTLVGTGRGFLPDPSGDLLKSTNGPVVPWLIGPFVYGLTRADRQDLAYRVNRNLAERILGRGMVGTIPGVLPARGDVQGEEADYTYGASLLGASEFLRTMYQDYLGIRVDAPSSVIRCEPNLPAEIRSADFTAYMGPHVVRGSYRKVGQTGRMSLSLSDVPRPVKWQFIWVFENGDAWVGAIHIQPGESATAVFTPGGVLVYQGDEEKKPEESWFVKGYTRSGETRGLSLAAAASGATVRRSQP